MREHHIAVRRTARFYSTGPWDASVGRLWFVLHGHSQLAAGFLQDFEILNDGSSLIIAPEALSRFYLETSLRGGHGPRIGATWMTREDRQNEIRDNTSYLDDLAVHVAQELGALPPDIRILGFSQGGATAARWVAAGDIPARQVILWGSPLPEEVRPGASDSAWREAAVTLVRGTEDPLVPRATLEAQLRQLEASGVRCRLVEFTGGHRIDSETLQALAREPQSRP